VREEIRGLLVMSKGKNLFKQCELARAIRAAQSAGVRDFTARVTPTGAIEIDTRAATESPTEKGADDVVL
jgi:hypothetical protein